MTCLIESLFKRFLFSSDSARFPPVFRKPQALVHSFFYIGSTGRESSPPPARLSRITDSPAHISNSSLVQRAQRHTSALSPLRIWSSFWHIIRARRNTSALRAKLYARLLNLPLTWAIVRSCQQAALLLGSWFKSQMGFSGWKFITLRVTDWNIAMIQYGCEWRLK